MSELTPEQAAAYIKERLPKRKVSAATLGNYRSQNLGPKYFKRGQLVRYLKTEVDNWIGDNG